MQSSSIALPIPHSWEWLQRCNVFWTRHPALFYGLVVFLSASAHFYKSPLVLIPAFALAITTLSFPWRLLLGLGLALTAFTYMALLYPLPTSIPSSGIQGTASITFDQIRLKDHPFGPRWVIRAHLHHFSGPQSFHNVPCTLNLPLKQYPTWETLPSPDYKYRLTGTLKQTRYGNFFLQIPKKTQWESIASTWNLLSWRYQCQQHLRSWIENRYRNPTVAHLFYGLVSGEMVDKPLEDAFQRLGLLHILAISGLHFSLFAGFLRCFAQIFFPYRWALLATCFALFVYFCFLGNSPSVLRAAIMSSIGLLAVWIERPARALNSLGIAMLFAVLWDPYGIRSLAFHLSYGVTGAILLFYPLARNAMEHLLPPRRLATLARMPILDQHGYLLLSFFREAVALGIAVQIFTIPYLLLRTKKIPIMGMLLNLFFPALLSLSLLAFLIDVVLSPIPWISDFFRAANEIYTCWVLRYAYNFPLE